MEAVPVRVERMLSAFRQGCSDLAEIWQTALRPGTFDSVRQLGRNAGNGTFRFPDELWADVVVDLACAYKHHALERNHVLAALTPLYLGRVASTVLEMESFTGPDVETRIEHLCAAFEQAKPGLVQRWNDPLWNGGSNHAMPPDDRSTREVKSHDRNIPTGV